MSSGMSRRDLYCITDVICQSDASATQCVGPCVLHRQHGVPLRKFPFT